MHIAYCSLLLPEEKRIAERAKKRLPGISLHKFTSAILRGLDENLDGGVDVFNIINTRNYPDFPQLVFKTEKWSHKEGANDWHISYVNLFGIKYMTQAEGLYRKLCKWVASKGDEPCLICVHHIYFPAMYAATKVKRKFGDQVKLCLITGDMNGAFGLAAQTGNCLKQRLTLRLEKKVDQLAKGFDCFVFATEHMAQAFGVEDKPFTVVECAYAEPSYYSSLEDTSDESEKIIFYAGALREEYGIPHLLRAFSMIEGENYRLWLAGGGNAEHIIAEFAEKDPRIEFLGFITPQEVDLRQKRATVLISARTTEYAFVKYSFPSKTMEGLASGKPYIAHRLPCDPPEYADYILYAEESDEALRDKMVQVCELPKAQRDAISQKARDFVLREKNPKIMSKRIVDMWKQVLGCGEECV